MNFHAFIHAYIEYKINYRGKLDLSRHTVNLVFTYILLHIMIFTVHFSSNYHVHHKQCHDIFLCKFFQKKLQKMQNINHKPLQNKSDKLYQNYWKTHHFFLNQSKRTDVLKLLTHVLFPISILTRMLLIKRYLPCSE